MPQKTRLVYGDFRPLHKGEAGYKAGARRYVSPSSGEVIGKGTYQRKAQRQTVNIPNKAERQELRQKTTHYISIGRHEEREIKWTGRDRYNMRLDQYVNQTNKVFREAGLREMTRGEAMRSAEFKMLYKDLASKDKSPNGKLARALVALGLRDEDADYDVGETP